MADGSDHSSTADNFRYRSIRWKRTRVADVRHNIDFGQQWDRFVSFCLDLVTKDSSSPLPFSDLPLDAEKAWNQFFQPVFEKAYTSEYQFSKDLLQALKGALGGIVDDAKVPNLVPESSFRLRNQSVGFAENLKRDNLFGDRSHKYGATSNKDNVCDHCCFVYGQNQHGPVFDATALVELKNGTSRCQEFKEYDDYLHRPALSSQHGSFAQATLYSLDVLHCLARRGVPVESLPTVVLNARSMREPNGTPYLYCAKGELHIPESCGAAFQYTVKQVVEYTDDNCEQLAAAIYVDALATGVANAIQVLRNEGSSPLHLFCQNKMVGDAELRLIASPIPFQNDFKDRSPNIKVNQADLFSCQSPNLQWLSQVKGAAIGYSFDNECNSDDDYIVKISCAAVHNCLVSRDTCCFALMLLFLCDDESLKTEIGKVLRAYRYSGESDTLLTVMRDIAKEGFGPLKPKNFLLDPVEKSRLWRAFRTLVISVLLPLAKLGVIHCDIRPGWDMTYNILLARRGNAVELRLLDYDSLVSYGMSDGAENKPAMHKGYLPESDNLLWQILWLANVWISGPSAYRDLEPEHFVQNLASFWRVAWTRHESSRGESFEDGRAEDVDSYYRVLKQRFDRHSTVACLSRQEQHNEDDIVSLLDFLGDAFDSIR